MTSNGDICSMIVARGIIERAMSIYGVAQDHRDDLRQEVLIDLLQLDNNRLNDLVTTHKLDAFITRMVRNMWRSKTSRYYYKYRHHETKTTTDIAHLLRSDE